MQAFEYSSGELLRERYRRIRSITSDLIAPLTVEDMVVQSMPNASPARWHLAHTSWFFEHFLLACYLDGYTPLRRGWDYLFNSYYYSVGEMYKRADRGLLSRPGVAEILDYRVQVDERMEALIDQRADDADFCFRVELGLNHEQQHQELLLTDIKHAFSLNPLQPAYRGSLNVPPGRETRLDFLDVAGGIVEIGAVPPGFCFDNETPRHQVLLQDYRLGSRLVTNAEYRDFIQDGGYRRSELWLSDGWATVQSRLWKRPIYWNAALDGEFSLGGELELDPNRCVSHVSYYEADAFARWAGARLPTEMEWEHVAAQHPVEGNLLDSHQLHPAGSSPAAMFAQLFGDTWEWTQSPYAAYPGFEPLAGSLGEYNGKFMCNQLVLRGGSCATPADHIRTSYRNFFYPDARWQFSGIRLAKNA